MTLLRLGLVTQTLLEVIRAASVSSPEWPAGGGALTSSPEPPDRLSGDHTIGLYLFHLLEDPSRRNLPVAGPGLPDRNNPMPLLLYYLLTAHSDLNGASATYEEQFLMGLAVKALRDVPIVDDSTVVAGVQVMPAALRGRDNRFVITPRAVQPAEAVSYWTVGQRPMRLASYYEVAATLLEPDPAHSRAGRVLTVGLYPVVSSTPRLTGSENEVSFLVPGEPAPRTVTLRPAEAAIGDHVAFLGENLTGDEVSLLVQGPAWPAPVRVDPIAWGVVPTRERVVAVVADTAGSWSMLPGVYTASVDVVTVRPLTGGGTHRIHASSNVTPFSVASKVTPSVPTAAGVVTVTGGRFDPAAMPEDDVQVFVGPDRLERRAGPIAVGQFRVVDDTHLILQLPAGLTSGASTPIRVVARGVESAPAWVVAP